MSNKIDWNELWMEKIDKATWSRLRKQRGGDSYWDLERARQFHRDSRMREGKNHKAEMVASRLNIRPEDTMLDIGAGTGNLTMALARKVRTVTAVEPLQTMIQVFKEEIESQNIQNIKIINKKWEEIVPGVDATEHDIVMASFSLSMRDIRAALAKMNQLAGRAVCLFTFVGNQFLHFHHLWPLLHGQDYDVGPDYLDLYHVLYDMGITANVDIKELLHTQRFDNLDLALKFWKTSLRAESPEHEKIIRSYLLDKFSETNGSFTCEHPMKMAMIWWFRENRKGPGPGDSINNFSRVEKEILWI